MSQNSKGKQDLGILAKGKNGSLYIKVDEDITLKAGDFLYLDKPEDRIKFLLEKNFIDENTAEQRLESFTNGKQSFIKFHVKKPRPSTNG